MRRLAVVRGADLNPFEMQAYRPLAADFDVRLVGRRRPSYEVDALGLPVTLLPGTNGTRLTAAVARRVERWDRRAEPGRLFGLAGVLADRQIVHAAETAIPLSHQCAESTAATGARLVLTCWENIAFRFDDDPRTAARKREVQAATDLFVAVTPSARAALRAEGVADERIVVVPAGVDTDRFTPDGGRDVLRPRLGLDAGTRIVLFVGRLIQEKGIVDLVQAFAALPHDPAHPVHLVLAGAGPEGPRVERAAVALGCDRRVHVIGPAGYAEVPDLHRSADIVAAPSLPTPYWQEQFGMVLVEALASGRALVTTRSGSIPEVVDDAAVLVEPYDVPALRDALGTLLDDEHARAERAAAGRDLALRRYAIDVVADRLRDAYRGLP